MQNNINSSLPIFIIGAGIAGVACAKKLQENGRKVIILEAKSSIGGRINSRKIDSNFFDLGASWIHGIDDNPIWSITQENNIETSIFNCDNLHYFHENGVLFSEKEVQEFELYLNKIEKLLHQTKKISALDAVKEIIFSLSYIGNTFSEDYLKKLLLSSFERIANDPFATNLDLLSSRYQDYEGYFQGDQVIFPKGYYQIIECISKNINIKLNIDVKTIIYNDDYVKIIDSNSNVYIGSHVVITVPLGVLKRNNIEFHPPLSNEYIHSIQSIGFGSFNKVFFELDQPLPFSLKNLGKDPSVFYWNNTGCFNILDLSKFYQKPTYLMLFGGDKSNFVDDSTDRQVSDFIFNSLQKQFNGISSKPKNIIITRWGADPYSHGSFSFPSINHNDDLIKILHKPIRKIIFFAGEHCSLKYAGTVHGAYLSGCETAEKISCLT